MPDVRLTPQDASADGVAPDYSAPLATTDTYLVNNHEPFLLHFKKTGAGACDVVFTGSAVGSIRKAVTMTVTVPASTGDVMVGPLDPNDLNAGEDVQFTLSEVTGLSVAVIRLPLGHRRA